MRERASKRAKTLLNFFFGVCVCVHPCEYYLLIYWAMLCWPFEIRRQRHLALFRCLPFKTRWMISARVRVGLGWDRLLGSLYFFLSLFLLLLESRAVFCCLLFAGRIYFTVTLLLPFVLFSFFFFGLELFFLNVVICIYVVIFLSSKTTNTRCHTKSFALTACHRTPEKFILCNL